MVHTDSLLPLLTLWSVLLKCVALPAESPTAVEMTSGCVEGTGDPFRRLLILVSKKDSSYAADTREPELDYAELWLN